MIWTDAKQHSFLVVCENALPLPLTSRPFFPKAFLRGTRAVHDSMHFIRFCMTGEREPLERSPFGLV